MKIIGQGTFINENVVIDRCESIGKYCSISKNVNIGLGSHPKEWVSTSPLFYSKSRGLTEYNLYNNKEIDKKVIIKNDVWIGNGAIVMPGVVIGNGAIIGANSVVTKDVPDYAIVVGTPAKVKKYRFKTDLIELFLKIRWWEIEVEELKNYVDIMNSPEEFLRMIEENGEKNEEE